MDLWPLLSRSDSSGLDVRPMAFYYNNNDLEAVRWGKWKFILPHSYRTLAGAPGSGGAPGPYKQVKTGAELYDLDIDPDETTDLAARRPDVVKKFEPIVERFRSDLGDSLIGVEGVSRRPAGAATADPRAKGSAP